ncbi:RNA polymerase sigma factor [Bacillus cereus]|nr:RNA polymerase sigma factor [Bacillus cereus]
MAFVKSDLTSSASEAHDAVLEALPSLRKYCMSLTGSPWDAEDLVQDACLKAIPVFRRPGGKPLQTEAYLLRTAKHAWIDRIRKDRNAQRLQHLHTLEDLIEVPDSDAGMELEAAMSLLLAYLSPLQRTVLMLREGLGYSAAETAALLHTTEGAVKSALHRARTVLRTGLPAEEERLPTPEGVDSRLLKDYLSAFRSGDAARLVELGLQGAVEPVVSLHAVLGSRAGRGQGILTNFVRSSSWRMAA